MEDRETARMRKYGESKTTRIMMATVLHVASGWGLRKFQADGFLLTRVYMWYNSVSIWFVSKHTLPVPYCNCVCFAFSIIFKNFFQYTYHKNFPPRTLHNPMVALSHTTGSAPNLRAAILSLHTVLLLTFFTVLLCLSIATTLSNLPLSEGKTYNRHFLFHLALAN